MAEGQKIWGSEISLFVRSGAQARMVLIVHPQLSMSDERPLVFNKRSFKEGFYVAWCSGLEL